MSVITDMVLVTFMEDRAAVDRLNTWCQGFDGDRGQRFAKLDEDMAGGSKWFTGQIWAMSGNYFRWYELVEALPTFGWRSPDNVLLLVDDEHGDEPLAFRGDGRRASWEPVPASGGVVEPSPLTAEEATPEPCDRTDLPEVSDMRCAGCGAEAGQHPAWRKRHRRHDPGALIEEPDLYEQGGHLDGEFADERGKFDPLIGEQGQGDDRG